MGRGMLGHGVEGKGGQGGRRQRQEVWRKEEEEGPRTVDTTSEDLEDTGGEEGRGKGTCDHAKGLMSVADMFILTN